MHPPEQIRPGPSAIEAAVSLLADSDPRVVATCRRQVLHWGVAAMPVLQRAAGSSDPTLRSRARALLRTLQQRMWLDEVDRFARAAQSRAADDVDVLEAGVVLLSSLGRMIEPSPAAVHRRLDELAAGLSSRLRGTSAASVAKALGAFLGEELRFVRRASRYELEGVAIDVVLDRRRGLPVMLALVYLLVARRIGIRARAVALPSHYLVRVHGTRSVLLDPMQGGAVVTRGDCIRYLRSIESPGAHSRTLLDVDDRLLLQGMVHALRRVFGWREDAETLRTLAQAGDLLR